MSNETFDLANFTNREAEIGFILKECLNPLKNNKSANPRFVEFNGVWGIGKTTMLRRFEAHCFNENLSPIWIDASDMPEQLSHKVAEQVRNRYNVAFTHTGDEADESFAAMEALLKERKVAVVLIDSLDAADEKHLKNIENMLHRFIDLNGLFFIMASRKIIDFQNRNSIKRKIKFFPLKSLSHDHSIFYMKKIAQELKEKDFDEIFRLTGGYPIAVDIALKTIKQEQLDPIAEQDQKRLMHVLDEQVIKQGILANVHHDPDQLLRNQTILSLLAVPRRFNLTITQKLVEKFAEQYKLGSGLAYMSLPRDINPGSDLLHWHKARAGFFMEPPIRDFLLVKSSIEDLARYKQVHAFLMEQNWRLAMEVSGTDRIHYIQEYLYHSASCLANDVIQDNINKATKQILAEVDDALWQFIEEYEEDKELQTALGSHKDKVLAKIYQYLADNHLALSSASRDKRERVSHLRSYVFYSIKDPTVAEADRLALFQMCLQRIREQETADVYRSLAETLSLDAEIKTLLGTDPQTWNLG
jgi:KAP family P-loop domain